MKEEADHLHMHEAPLHYALLQKRIKLAKQTRTAQQENQQKSIFDAEEKYHALMVCMLENVPDCIWAKDLENCFLFTNKSMRDKLLRSESLEETLGKNDLYFAQRERDAGHEHTFGEICVNSDEIVKKNAKQGRFLEYGLIRGKRLILDVFKAPLFDSDGTMIGTVGYGRDVTKEKATEVALAKASTVFRSVTNDIDGIAVQGYDENRRVTLWNRASEKLYGYTEQEAMGQRLENLIIPEPMKEDVIQLHRRWIQGGERIPSGELTLRDKWGNDVYVFSDHTLQPTSLGREMFCIDINLSPIKKAHAEKQQIQEQLERAKRMEAIGTLAGGIAHDFNNILAAIMGYTELIKIETPEGSKVARNLDSILQASQRASELVKQILAFSRKEDQPMQATNIGLIVQEAMCMVRSSIPSTVVITTQVEQGDDLVFITASNIHRIVVNLCTNAMQAMWQEKGHIDVSLQRIRLTTEDIQRMKGTANTGRRIRPGTYAFLRVKDSGQGMSQDIQEQIFEPYFTTKERGRGTGLGLSTVHGIVQGSKGFILLDSQEGQGTSVSIYLPIIPQNQQVKKSKHEPVPSTHTGSEHILLVDDEPAICEVGKSTLERLGYTVTTVTQSKEALKLFASSPERYDLVISDQVMPDLTGEELACEIRQINPLCPFILCTGYPSNFTEEKARQTGIQRVLSKPLRNTVFTQNIRAVLDAAKL